MDGLKSDIERIRNTTETNHGISENKFAEFSFKIGEGEKNLEKMKDSLDSALKDAKLDLKNEIQILGCY